MERMKSPGHDYYSGHTLYLVVTYFPATTDKVEW
jgi:hypothetical protein